MDIQYLQSYPHLYRNHWWWRARENLLLRIFRAALTQIPSSARRFLDIGGGEGLFMEQLSQFGSVHACDPSLREDSITEFGPIFGCSVERADIFPDKYYDATLLLDVIEHVQDDVALLREAHRVTKKGGIVIVTVPAYQALWTTHDEDNHHLRRYSPTHFRSTLESASLRVEKMGALFLWSAVVKYIMGRYEDLTGAEFRGSSIPMPLVNRVLTAITFWEGVIMLRLGLMGGSSLFAVCSVR